MSKKTKPATKINNLVAKHSANKSGAGAHKSKKDYRRKGKDNNKLGED